MRIIATLALFVLTACLAAVHGTAPAAICLFLGSAALIQPGFAPGGAFCTVTLTPTILAQQTMRKLFVKVPMLRMFAHEFTTERLKKDQQVVGKIRLRPTVSEYDTTYKTGAQETRDLLLDVNFVMDKHIHVTMKMSHLYALTDSMNKLEEHIEDAASVIGKSVLSYMLGKINSRSFTNATVYSESNSDRDMLNGVRKALNLRGVPDGRFGIVNSNVAETLDGDARITNRNDNGSQSTDGSGLIRFNNLAGFGTIFEYPELDDLTETAVAVTGEADNEVFTFGAAHGLLVDDRVYLTISSGGTGLTSGYFFVKTVPSTTTLTLSTTRGGSTAAFSADIVGTIGKKENITGIFGTREGVAFKTGLPIDGLEAARAFGIPTPVRDVVVTDPDSGLSMVAYEWFEVGTMDTYVTLAMLYGGTAGMLADTAKHVMEPSIELLRSE
jgi:hypothetical protein